jgi:hypothetical protein
MATLGPPSGFAWQLNPVPQLLYAEKPNNLDNFSRTLDAIVPERSTQFFWNRGPYASLSCPSDSQDLGVEEFARQEVYCVAG